MPATLLTLPRELRDEISTHLARSSSFAFLLACRQLNEEGTPLLYKHGIYRVRALSLRRRRSILAPLPPPPTALIRNLYISMPPIRFGDHKSANYEISRRTAGLLGRFAGTEIRRRVCHFDLQDWTLSAGMAKVLGGYGGFDVVRVEVRLKPYSVDYDGRVRPFDPEGTDEQKEKCVRLVQGSLESALGTAKWENKDSGNCFEEVMVAGFQPRASGS